MSTKLPSKIGANKGTLILAGFVIVVTTGVSFALNAYDNRLTRTVNTVRAGQLPLGI